MLSSSTVLGDPWVIDSSRWHFVVVSATYFGPPSTSTRLGVGCKLAKHVFQYRTEKDEMRLMSGAELRRLRIPYSRILVYKITVPSAKNDVYRTGRFHFGSAHRPVDGIDICRELYDHVVSSILLPDDPFSRCEIRVAIERSLPMP